MTDSSILKAPFNPAGLLDAARVFGTPTYVYSERIVRRQCRLFSDHLQGIPHRLLYAMKANSNPAVLAVLLSEGLGIDAVSPGELLLADKVGFSHTDILYSANNMTDEEMEEACRLGVLLNIGELSRLDKLGRFRRGTSVCVRLNPQIGAGHHEHVITAGSRSKFGIPVEEIGRVHDVAARHDMRIVGLHQHIGSGILDSDTYWAAMRVLLESATEFPHIRFLNFGGGLGIAYSPAQQGLDLESLGERIVSELTAFGERHPSPSLDYWFEPGRFLVAEAGVLLVTVNTLKTNRGRTFAGTDSGMGHLVRPAIYGAYHGIYNLTNPDGALLTYDVSGNICENGDMFARDRPIPEIREGDVLAILDAGAYGMAMASEYNLRPLPAEVLLTVDDELRLVRRRCSPESVVDRLLQDAAPGLEAARGIEARGA